jgi:hypothetical protein
MALIDDSSPELGGNLNLNGYAVTDYVNGAIRFASTPFEDISIINTATGTVIFAGTTTGKIWADQAGVQPDISIIRHCVSRGTLTSPENTHPGDFLSAQNVSGYVDGEWKTATAVMTRWAPGADLTQPHPASVIGFLTGSNGTMDTTNLATFNEQGVFTAPIFSATSYTTEALPVAPGTGWMVFDKTTNEFKGWNGTNWVVLG